MYIPTARATRLRATNIPFCWRREESPEGDSKRRKVALVERRAFTGFRSAIEVVDIVNTFRLRGWGEERSDEWKGC